MQKGADLPDDPNRDEAQKELVRLRSKLILDDAKSKKQQESVKPKRPKSETESDRRLGISAMKYGGIAGAILYTPLFFGSYIEEHYSQILYFLRPLNTLFVIIFCIPFVIFIFGIFKFYKSLDLD
jgi:hypothetical protein